MSRTTNLTYDELIAIFTDQQFKKPEVYQVGDYVEILESVIDCTPDVATHWVELANEMIGKIGQIILVRDNFAGINYEVDYKINSQVKRGLFPHYSVKKVKKPKETLELTLEEIAKKFGVENVKIVK